MEKKAVRVAYGEALVKLGQTNNKVVVLDADLASATMTNAFKKEFPGRFYDCGIAEANMVDMAAGMSTMGLIPFCSTFAVFAGRNYDQIRNGVCYPKFNVKFGFSHAGITLGEDGGSHQAIEDIALMRVLPGMTVFVPSDANECYQCVEAAAKIEGPVFIRTARLATPVYDPRPFTVGKGTVILFGIDEKFALADKAFGAAQLMHQLEQIGDLLRRERRGGLLTVAERGIGDPDFVRHLHGHVAVVEGDFRHGIVIEQISLQIG